MQLGTIIAMLLVLLTGCSQQGQRIAVVNETGTRLSNITLGLAGLVATGETNIGNLNENSRGQFTTSGAGLHNDDWCEITWELPKTGTDKSHLKGVRFTLDPQMIREHKPNLMIRIRTEEITVEACRLHYSGTLENCEWIPYTKTNVSTKGSEGNRLLAWH